MKYYLMKCMHGHIGLVPTDQDNREGWKGINIITGRPWTSKFPKAVELAEARDALISSQPLSL